MVQAPDGTCTGKIQKRNKTGTSIHVKQHVCEWLLFNAKWVIYQLYHGRTSRIWWAHAKLDFYTSSSLIQQSAKSTCRSTRTYYPYSESTSLCSYSVKLGAYLRSNIYRLYILWFDSTGAGTHDLRHSMWFTIVPLWYLQTFLNVYHNIPRLRRVSGRTLRNRLCGHGIESWRLAIHLLLSPSHRHGRLAMM